MASKKSFGVLAFVSLYSGHMKKIVIKNVFTFFERKFCNEQTNVKFYGREESDWSEVFDL